MKEEVFKVGDKVYDAFIGKWGEVASKLAVGIRQGKLVNVRFLGDDNQNLELSYYPEEFEKIGYRTKKDLSFTKYEVKLKGYSQDRKMIDIKKYEPIFVKYVSGELWEIRRFSHFKDGKCFVYYSQNMKYIEKSGTHEVEYWSIDNPLKKEV